MIGRRVYTDHDGKLRDLCRPGDYAKVQKVYGGNEGSNILRWDCIAPDGSKFTMNPKIYRIEEHEDASISVIVPSIVTTSWRGTIIKGEWIKAT